MPGLKFCTDCGAPTHGERFCTSCGRQLADQSDGGAVGSEQFATGAEPAGAATAVRVHTEVRDAETARRPSPPASPPIQATGDPAAHATPPPETRWLPAAISAAAVLVLAGVVAIVLLTAGGSPAAKAKSGTSETTQLTNTLLASRQLYATVRQPSYSALLPAGWKEVATGSPGLTAAITAQSPVDGGAKITVAQISNPTKTLKADASKLLRGAASSHGFHQQTSGATTLAGGRPAWVTAYQTAGQSAAEYVVSSCGNSYAVSATVPPSWVSLLRARIGIVASTLQGIC